MMIRDDDVDHWENHLDTLVASVADNSGRSCVNASGIWVTRHGDAIAEALAGRLAAIAPRASEDPEAALAPFVDRGVAERMSALVDRLNLGAIPTNRIVWDQPHEGNLFEHLYGRRAIQRTA